MTREDVKKRVAEMHAVSEHCDAEYPHQLEDWLYLGVLRAISEGSEDAAGLAVEALKTREFITVRWYA